MAEYLEQEIYAGKYKIGDLLPTEQVLCQRFDASRFTIREALKKLMELGLVVRRQGSGTRVIAIQRSENFIQELHTANDVIQYAENTRLSVINDQDLIEQSLPLSIFPAGCDENWHKIHCVGLLNDEQNICWTEVYILPEYKSITPLIDKHEGPVFELVEQEFGITPCEVKVEIQAGAADSRRAQLLQIEEASPLLIVIRRYFDDQARLYQVSISEHPSEKFSYSINLLKQSNQTSA